MTETTEYPSGFASVADFIAKDPDNSTAIFRKFDRLAARNLLHLQGKLQKLEAEQDAFDQEILDLEDDYDAAIGAASWEDFERLATTEDREGKRMRLAEDIQKTMKEYHNALFLYSNILAQPPPLSRTLRAYKDWFNPRPDRGFPMLAGHCSTILDNENDLIALKRPLGHDRLTHMIVTYLPWLFITHRGDGKLAYASERRIAQTVAIFSILAAGILIIGAIIALHRASSQDMRIGLIALFTAIFAGGIGILTGAGRTEAFAATAAYAAVLVVFISGNPPA